jgi:hypothetical protein
VPSQEKPNAVKCVNLIQLEKLLMLYSDRSDIKAGQHGNCLPMFDERGSRLFGKTCAKE